MKSVTVNRYGEGCSLRERYLLDTGTIRLEWFTITLTDADEPPSKRKYITVRRAADGLIFDDTCAVETSFVVRERTVMDGESDHITRSVLVHIDEHPDVSIAEPAVSSTTSDVDAGVKVVTDNGCYTGVDPPALAGCKKTPKGGSCNKAVRHRRMKPKDPARIQDSGDKSRQQEVFPDQHATPATTPDSGFNKTVRPRSAGLRHSLRLKKTDNKSNVQEVRRFTDHHGIRSIVPRRLFQ